MNETQVTYMENLPSTVAAAMTYEDQKKFLLVFGSQIVARYDTLEEAMGAKDNKFVGLCVALVNGAEAWKWKLVNGK